MNTRLYYEPLQVSHLDELAEVLLDPLVYEHIELPVPDPERFKLALTRAIAGPPPGSENQVWLNYLVRNGDGEMIGRLEATIHDSIAEVAFLFGPSHWGQGYAQEGLSWLHSRIKQLKGGVRFWATTLPENYRCQALLRRCGYVQIDGPFPVLLSYAERDLVFTCEN